MAISIKHDAFGVVPPSNAAQRKYGQSLVLQQQQQKYQTQQANADRLFQLAQQQQPFRNNWQWGGKAQQGRQQAGGIIQQGGQQRGFGLTTTVDAQKQAMADAEQRKKDFEAARSRMDTYAKDMLANGEIEDQETKNKIRNLIAGKTIVMGSGFDETARKNYLDQYNAELSKILSEVPPPKAKAPPQPNFHTDQNGNQWVESGPGKWEQVPVQPTQPASPTEAFKAEPKTDDKYQKMAEARLMGPDNEMPQVDSEEVGADGKKKKRDMTPQEFQKAVKELKADLWNIDNTEEAPTVAPDISSGAIQSPPQEASILEQSAPAGIPIAPPDPEQQALAQKLRDGMNGKIDDKAYDAAYREWTSKYGNSEEAEKYFNAADELIKSNGGKYNKEWQELIKKGHNAKNGPINPFTEGEPQEAVQQAPPTTQPPSPAPVTGLGPNTGVPELDANGNLAGHAPGNQREPLPLTSNSTSQNELAGADQPAVPGDATQIGDQNGITMQTASDAARQYEGAAQQLKSLQAEADILEQKIKATAAIRGDVRNRNAQLEPLKKERDRVKSLLQTTKQSMQEADKTARGYYDQEIAKQPSAQKLAKSGKRPQDFAEAEFQLQSLRKQYPDMGSMPAEAKKQLKEAMAVIQAGR